MIKQKVAATKYLLGWQIDSDGFNRYEAGQNYFNYIVAEMLAGNSVDLLEYAQIFGKILDENIDNAFKAYLIMPTNVGNFVQLHENTNMHKLAEVYAKIAQFMSIANQNKILDLYHKVKNGRDEFNPYE